MPYTKQTWVDGSSQANAARLNFMETGIDDGYFSSLLDVDGKFGGGWAGVQAAVTEAHNSGGPSAVVLMGRSTYNATSTINITRPITIMGGGIRGTRIRHSGAFTGPVFRAENLKRNGQWESTVSSAPINSYDDNADDGGLTLRDFSIVDDNRSTANRHGIYCLDGDDMLMENIQFGMLTGTALKLGADEADANLPAISSGRIRECDFRRIRIYRCGAGSPNGTPDVPAFILQNASSGGDGSNQNYFEQFRFVYNEGRMLIRGAGFNDGNGVSSLRRTIFRDMQLHALADNNAWSPSQWFPFDLVTLEGSVRETLFDGVMVNGNRAGTACWRMVGHGLNAETPKRLVLKNIQAINIHGSLVRVSAGDTFTLEGSQMTGSVEQKIVIVDAGSGFSRGSVYEHGLSQFVYDNAVGQRHAGDFDINAGSVNFFYHGLPGSTSANGNGVAIP